MIKKKSSYIKKDILIKGIMLVLFTLFSMCLFSQVTETEVFKEDAIVVNQITKQNFKAKKYTFPEGVYNSYIDTLAGTFRVQLHKMRRNINNPKNKGKLVLYDFKEQKVKWIENFKYEYKVLCQQDSILIVNGSGNRSSFCLNTLNGKKNWSIDKRIAFIDTSCNICIGSDYSYRYSYKIVGFSYRDSEVLWERDLKYKSSLNNYRYLNDTTLLLVSDGGLHAINIKNGSGWDYKTVTVKNNHMLGADIVQFFIGASMAAAFNVDAYDYGNYNNSRFGYAVRNITSNLVVDSTDVYFASIESISRIDKNTGVAKWTYSLPKKKNSTSSVFSIDSVIYMLNLGLASDGSYLGEPYLLALSKKTGKKKYISKFNVSDNWPIYDYKLQKDTLLIAFRNNISVMYLNSGVSFSLTSINLIKQGHLDYFIRRPMYVQTKDSLLRIISIDDTEKHYLFTGKCNILILNKTFSLVDLIKVKRIHHPLIRTKNYHFLAIKGFTYIINSKNEVIAKFDSGIPSKLVGNKLYCNQGKNLLVIDLTKLFRENKNTD
jgi:hypothetical protein